MPLQLSCSPTTPRSRLPLGRQSEAGLEHAEMIRDEALQKQAKYTA